MLALAFVAQWMVRIVFVVERHLSFADTVHFIGYIGIQGIAR